MRYQPVAKMTDESLLEEYRKMDHRFFSIRRRYVEAELEKRKLQKEETQ